MNKRSNEVWLPFTDEVPYPPEEAWKFPSANEIIESFTQEAVKSEDQLVSFLNFWINAAVDRKIVAVDSVEDIGDETSVFELKRQVESFLNKEKIQFKPRELMVLLAWAAKSLEENGGVIRIKVRGETLDKALRLLKRLISWFYSRIKPYR